MRFLITARSKGDTIIEVMLALTIFSMLAVGALAIMNRGVAGSQDALEATMVRNEMDAQAETLRFLHQAYMNSPSSSSKPVTEFKKLINDNRERGDIYLRKSATEFGKQDCINNIPYPDESFVVNPNTGSVVSGSSRLVPMASASATEVFAQLTYDKDGRPVSNGMWIEAVGGSSTSDAAGTVSPYIDFHIRACWNAASSGVPRTLGTIVRLYYV